MTPDLTPFLHTALDAARSAGGLALAFWNRPFQVDSKSAFRDVVTDADFECQKLIKTMIAGRFPDHGFLAEEKDAIGDTEAEYRWIIDPLDGTTNYSHHYPAFCVSIALTRRDEVLVGVVFDPVRNDLFSATRGGGALLNGRRIQVSAREDLTEVILGTEWPRDYDLLHRSLGLVARFGLQVQTLRVVGAAALSLCYVAAGWSDVYFHLRLFPWDVAAAGLILEEAGGRLTHLDGRPWAFQDQAYLASNGHLHAAALRGLRSAAVLQP